ncbi:hypothetical protein DDZ18_08570 [Marinicauda salina]|uniref:DUF4345 domain-containing protein n=1 Tax=Marinicauda salina TaxID=2135793 RepID=A0A2U2BUM3_9PROT|nr:hypothetical protein [Marinicauda salina]PWE17702.1 hypothetical protein DDZ18_08570 [Marinicauda salina]
MLDWPTSWYIAAGAALIGAVMGAASLAVPRWGQGVVRLAPDPRWKGGWAEFRASYGGGFLFVHAAVLLTLAMSFQAGAGSVIGASFAASLYWFGMAVGRIVSLALDAGRDTRTGYNVFSVGFEAAMGLALLAPFLGHLGG